MRKEKFTASQGKRFNKFLERLDKAREKKNFKRYDFMFCRFENGYLFGDSTHFEYAECDSVADHLKQYESECYTNILQSWKRANYEFSEAEAGEVEMLDGKKLIELGNAYGLTYINPKYVPALPDDAVFRTCTTKTGDYPVQILVDGKAIAYIMPIHKPQLKEA